ncbi:hypothetical protein DFJ74DRAFT_697604 [Hyaloraphidium curvatum]|nr:hypothetical protein DFJ74DRAFT_697604 [Hyaloraphidium curvatum]
MRSPKWAVRVAGRPAWESARRPRNSAGPDRRSRGEAVPARGLRWTTRSGCWRGLFRGLGDGSETGESTPAASSQASTPSAVAKWRTHPGATLARDAGPAVRIDEIPKPATSPSRTPLFPLHSPGNPSETAMAYPDTASAPLLPSSSAPAAPKSRSRAWCLALAGLAVLLPLVLIPAASVGGWEVSVETEIKGRPEQAWAVLQDVEGWPRWDVGLERAEVETPIVVGRVGKVHLKERGTFDITFVAADPPVPGPVRVVYRSEHTGAKMDWYWNFTPLNATAGAYGFRMGVEVSGPLASLYRAVIGKEAAESFAECVPLFKKCAEEQEV